MSGNSPPMMTTLSFRPARAALAMRIVRPAQQGPGRHGLERVRPVARRQQPGDAPAFLLMDAPALSASSSAKLFGKAPFSPGAALNRTTQSRSVARFT